MFNEVLAVLRREILSLFTSPIATTILAAQLFLFGFFFITTSLSLETTDLTDLYSNFVVILFIAMPLLGMRLFSEEKKSGTLELLLTSPIRSSSVVLGKYLSALALFLLCLLLTSPYVIYLAVKGEVLWKILLLQNLGLVLVASSILSIAMFLSSLTENQIISGMLAVGVNLTLFLLGRFSAEIGGPLHLILDELTMTAHFSSFLKGIFDLKDLIYFLLWPVFSIFLVQRVLESRRWLSN